MERFRLFKRSGKLNFSEHFFPARPRKLWSKARGLVQIRNGKRIGPAIASNEFYVKWLKSESMLNQANKLATSKYSGRGSMWERPFAKPRPRTAVRRASVWYTAYASSLITKDSESILAMLGNDDLWKSFETIGIKAIHTGPVKLAGGIKGWAETPSIDGQFDRISTKIDPIFGNDEEFRRMCETAHAHGGVVIDDIVPGHTGKGSDFRLAEMGFLDYPGIYHMVEIPEEDWYLLPDVKEGEDSANLNVDQEESLKKKRYIIGRLQRVIFYEPGVKETNWSATRKIKGVDGVERRWVYLHYFKEGQPSINWLDPTFAGMKLVVGDALHSLGELGTSGLRLDANGFLGVEKTSEDQPAWSEGHPLSAAANQLISGMVRKVGGFTFQELNLSIDDIKAMSLEGADLSYDFVNRPAYHHALATGDTEYLRLTMRTALQLGVDPASLVHALQNHDELTFELVHFWTVHKDDIYNFRGQDIKGLELRDIIRKELTERLTGENAPYNLLFTTNGIACTTASIIAASLGYNDLSKLDEADVNRIKYVHLLLVMYNALQPGVFALSGWDLSGSLTIDHDKVRDLIADGDTRWVNRGAYDLLGSNPFVDQSAAGMPLSRNLYGALPVQLADENSFANNLRRILAVRDKYSIATSHQVDIPDVSNKSLLVMVQQLNKIDYEVTVLNFSNKIVSESITSKFLPEGYRVTNMFNDQEVGKVNSSHSFEIELAPYQGVPLLVKAN